jgi:hypothetical protein
VLKIDHGGAKAGKVNRPQYNGSCVLVYAWWGMVAAMKLATMMDLR